MTKSIGIVLLRDLNPIQPLFFVRLTTLFGAFRADSESPV